MPASARKQRLVELVRRVWDDGDAEAAADYLATAYFFDAEDRLTGHRQVTDRLGVYQQLQRTRAGVA